MARNAPPSGGQGQGGSGSDLGPFWLMLGAIIGMVALWYAAHTYIISFMFAIKQAQAELVNFFLRDALLPEIRFMQSQDPSMVTWKEAVEVYGSVGRYIRYPFAAVLFGLAAIVYFSNLTSRFRRAHSMKTLREQEQKNWPQIMPVVPKDLINEDIRKGPWAMASSPMEFAKMNNLLKRDELTTQRIGTKAVLTATIRRGEARRVFALQLGAYWTGFDALPPHTLAICAALMAKINRDRDAVSNLLKQLSASSVTGKLNMTGVHALIEKYKNTEEVQTVIYSHAYVLTVMASLLEAAREDGVLATSDFLWLKPVDRRLWFMLNCVGRQTPFAEISGPFAHWLAEKALGRKSLVPIIEEATKSLETAVKEVRLTPKEWDALREVL